MLVLSADVVERLLEPDRLRRAVADAMADLSAGRASMPNRVAADVTEREAFLAAMPAYLPSSRALTTKLVSVFPTNRDRPTHQAVLVCFDAENGAPLALMDATTITAARTAAASALSVELLAGAGASVLAVLGTGVQARAHLRAVPRVRAFERIVVAGRDPDAAEALAGSMRGELGRRVEAATTFEQAARAADVICATTHASEPVVRYAWLSPGTHVASVGFNPAGLGEVDAETVVRSGLFVESRAAALAPPPSGAVELIGPIARGQIDAEHVRAEIGELVARRRPGRMSAEEVTLYKSVGVAVQDAAAAALVLDEARRTGVGVEIDV